jgi:hypothetical protein
MHESLFRRPPQEDSRRFRAGSARNTIAFNGINGPFSGSAGVAIYSDPGDPVTGNRILGNSIFSKGGLGIDLVGGSEDPDGRTANDGVPDADTGANNLQNFPVISSARDLLDRHHRKGHAREHPERDLRLTVLLQPQRHQRRRQEVYRGACRGRWQRRHYALHLQTQ